MYLAFLLIKWSIKICVLMALLEFWLAWAMLALPAAAIASVAGHPAVSRRWMRSLNWQRVFRL